MHFIPYTPFMEEEVMVSCPPHPQPPPSPEHDEEGDEEPEMAQPRVSISYQVRLAWTEFYPSSSDTACGLGGDACNCFIISLAFWAFASIALTLNLVSSTSFTLGPNTSWLVQPNSLFVQDIKVASEESNDHPLILYGFSSPPALSKNVTWIASVNEFIAPHSHYESMYCLNKGSKIYISYDIRSYGSYPLILAITKGKEALNQWIADPTSSQVLSWNLIDGSGEMQQMVSEYSNYYITISNTDEIEMEVHLKFKIEATLYDTRGAYYECSSLNETVCILKLPFMQSNVGIIETSAPTENKKQDWNITITYGPRWIIYFAAWGIMTIIFIAAFEIMSCLKRDANSTAGMSEPAVAGGVAAERTPLLPSKDDDGLSLGSSYDSNSHHEDDEVEGEEHGQTSGSSYNENLCAICFDAPKDCFYLPCGHRATCFACGMRIAQEAGTCPVCRKKIKKAKKIFSV